MAYEDPNAPSPVSSNYAQQSTSPVDQSKRFLGGQHHLAHKNAQLRSQLDQALFIIDVQKKVSMLMGLSLGTLPQGGI